MKMRAIIKSASIRRGHIVRNINRDRDKNNPNGNAPYTRVVIRDSIFNTIFENTPVEVVRSQREGLRDSQLPRKGEVALLATLNHTLRYEDVMCNSSTKVDRLSIAASHFPVSQLDPANDRSEPSAWNRAPSREYSDPINRKTKGVWYCSEKKSLSLTQKLLL